MMWKTFAILALSGIVVAHGTDLRADTAPRADQGGKVDADPLEVDPLLGFEIETLRRMLNDALGRIEELEERVRVLDEALQGNQTPAVESQ